MASGEVETQPAEQPTSVRWGVLALACGTSWLLYFHRYTWNVFSPELKSEYNLDDDELFFLGSLFNWTYGPSQVPSGIACDFFGPHLFLGIAIVGWSLVLPVMGWVRGYPALCAVRLLFGASQAGAYPALSRVTHSWFPARYRTIVQGWVATFFGRGGGFLSPIIMGTFLMAYCGLSWRVALVVMSLIGIVFGIGFLVLFRNSPDVHPGTNQAERDLIMEGDVETSTGTGHVLPWREAVRHRGMRFFIVQQFTSAGADTFFSISLGVYFTSGLGVPTGEHGLLLALPLLGGSVGGMIGAYANDWLIAKTGNRRRSRSTVGFVGKAIAAGLMLVVMMQHGPVAAAVVLFLVKFFTDWSQPTVWGTCTDLGGRYSATVFSIINTSGTIGGIACPVMFGTIVLKYNKWLKEEGASVAGLTNYGPVLAIVALMYLISACCWFGIDCTDSLDRADGQADPAAEGDKT